MERVIVTNPFVGICGMQVCAVADATDKEILAVCNSENPSGTTNGWGEVIREVKEEGFMNSKNCLPVVCKDYPDRLHFIVVC
jgi:hypothetical protein